MSQIVTVRVVMPKRAVSKLSRRFPPEKWGGLLEKSVQNAKAFQGPARLLSGAEVAIELEIPQKASRKISYLARKWGVSWPVVIWTLLQADEIPAKGIKKKEKRPGKHKIKHKESGVPETKTRVIMNAREKEELLKEADRATVELDKLIGQVDSLKLLIEYVAGKDGMDAERVSKRYFSEINELRKEIEKIGRRIRKDKATPKDIEKLGALILGIEALKEKLQEEGEAWGGMLLDDTLSEEGAPEEGFKVPKKANSSQENAVEENARPATIEASPSLRSFFALAKRLGAKRMQVTRDGRIEFLSEDKTAAGTYPLGVELPDDLIFEIPKGLDFSKLQSLTLSRDGILFGLTDRAELVPAEVAMPGELLDVSTFAKDLSTKDASKVVLKWSSSNVSDLPFIKEAFKRTKKVLREAMRHGEVVYIELPSGRVYSAGKNFPKTKEDVWLAELEGKHGSIWDFEAVLPEFVVERGDGGIIAIKKKHLRTILEATKDWDYVALESNALEPNIAVLKDEGKGALILTAPDMPDIIDVYYAEKHELPRRFYELEAFYGPVPQGFKHQHGRRRSK